MNDGKFCALLGHEGSTPCSPHNNAVVERQALLNQAGHLENVVAAKDDEKVERNRLRLKEVTRHCKCYSSSVRNKRMSSSVEIR